MSDDNFDDIDDLDLDGFDDFGSFDDFSELDGEDERTVIEQLKAGAMDTLSDGSFLSDISSSLIKNALPEEYNAGLDLLKGAINFSKDLYNDSKKELKEPFNDFRENSAKILESIEIENDLLEKTIATIKPEEEEEVTDNISNLSDEDRTVNMLLNGFEREAAAADQELELTSKINEQQTVRDISLLSELRKHTAFQDSIEYDFIRKSIEIQHRSLFVNREILDVLKAGSADTLKGLKAITKNTSLPDFLKATLSDGTEQALRDRILGAVGDKASSAFGNFGARLSENASNRIGDLTRQMSEGLGLGNDILGGLAEGSDDIPMAELLGMLGSSLIGEQAAERIGKKVNGFLAKNPMIKKYGEEIAFLAENYPTELPEILDQWDGGFPESVVERFPILENINLGFLADEIRGIIPTADEYSLKIQSNLEGNTGLESRFYDEISRRTLVEIIPGYLSRMLQQLTIGNEGPDAERVVYDVNSETFATLSEASRRITEDIQGGKQKTIEENRQLVRNELSGTVKLSDENTDAVLSAIEGLKSRYKTVDQDSVLNQIALDQGDQVSEEVRRSFASKRLSETDSKEAFDRASKATEGGLRKEIIARRAAGELNPGRVLSPEAQVAWENWIDDNGLAGTRPKPEEMRNDLESSEDVSPATIDELEAFLTRSLLRPRKLETVLAKAAVGMADTYNDSQIEINRLYALGQKDLLDATNVTAISDSGKSVINKDFGKRTVGSSDSMSDEEMEIKEVIQDDLTPPGLNVPPPVTGDRNGPMPSFTMDETSLVKKLWERFTIPNTELGLPVHVLSLPEGALGAKPEQMQPDPIKKEILTAVKAGFILQAELLESILQKDVEVNIQQPPGFFTQAMQSAGDIVSGGLNIGASYTKGIYGLTNSLISGGGNAIGGALNFAAAPVRGLFGLGSKALGAGDIYIEGNPDPVIKSRDLRNGIYFDQETGERIRDIGDIENAVVDAEGNVILTAEEIEAGIYDREGLNISDLTGIIGSGLRGLGGIYLDQVEFAGNMAKKIFNAPMAAARAFLDRPRDIYVTGEDKPRLTAFLMRNGGYFSEKTGAVIERPSDIDGQVVDNQGNILLSHEDFRLGLVDASGNAVDLNVAVAAAKRALGLLTKGATFAKDVAVGTVKAGIDTGMAALGGVASIGRGAIDLVTGNAINRAADTISALDNMGSGGLSEEAMTTLNGTNTILTDILTFMVTRWPAESRDQTEMLLAEQLAVLEGIRPEAAVYGDSDGDGDRDNSLADIAARRNAARANQNPTADEGLSEDEEEESKPNGLLGLLGGMSGMISSGLSSMVGALGTISSTVTGLFALAKAGLFGGGDDDLLDMDADDVDRDDKDKKKRKKRTRRTKSGKKGVFKKLVSGAKNLGKKAISKAGASFVGGQLLKRGGAMGATALAAGTIAAPLVAAAATAWTVYEIGSYFYDRRTPDELEGLRFKQYGLNPNDGGAASFLRELEDTLMEDYITVGKSGVAINIEPQAAFDIVSDMVGLSSDDFQYFDSWWTLRFIPIFANHISAAFAIDQKIDILDIDDDMDDVNKKDFVMKVLWLNNLSYFGHPANFLGFDQLSFAELVNSLKNIKAKYESEEAPKDKDVTTDAELAGSKKDREIAQGATAAKAMVDARKAQLNSSSVNPYVMRAQQATATTGATTVAAPAPTQPKAPAPQRTDEPVESGSIKMIKPCRGRLTSPYGRRKVKKKMKMHRGVDWADKLHSPIRAAEAGTIVRSGYSSSYGYVVYIRHENGWHTRYAHLSFIIKGMAIGTKVVQGTQIGGMGNSGKSRGVHLHFELRDGYGNDSKTYDPLKYIVNGKKEATKAKETEKQIVNESKEKMEDSIEGVDTIVSTAMAKAKVDKPVITDDDVKKSNEVSDSIEDLRTAGKSNREKQSEKSLQGINISTTRLEDIGREQVHQLNKLNKTTAEVVSMLAELIGVSETIAGKEPVVVNMGDNEGQASRGSKKPRKGNKPSDITPVVDLFS